MIAYEWHGVGDYDYFLKLSGNEMRELADHYHVDWSFFTSSPSKTFGEDDYYCFISLSRKALALLPFLSIAYGGMYDELPWSDESIPIEINYADYLLESFSFENKGSDSRDTGKSSHHGAGLKGLLKRYFAKQKSHKH